MKLKNIKNVLSTAVFASLLTSSFAIAGQEVITAKLHNSGAHMLAADQASAIAVSVSAPASEFSNLPHFVVGERSQRVRFYISGAEENTSLITAGEGYNKMNTDRVMYDRSNDFYARGQALNNVSSVVSPAIVKNQRWSMIAQPAVMMCFTDLLKRIVDSAKDPGVKQAFADFRIDELNLHLKPVVSEKLMSRAVADEIKQKHSALTLRLKQVPADIYQIQSSPRFKEINAWIIQSDRMMNGDISKKPENYDTIKSELDGLKQKIESLNAEKIKLEADLQAIGTEKILLAKRIISVDGDTALEISRVQNQKLDPAINIQIPFITNSYNYEEQCVLPSVKDITNAILTANGKSTK